mmetsp:Transcript_9652/g.22324  ORF Transcript_9652/g.22324 Transcript_9652/m.22324 type:complete len:257 (+) Transcript_9652:375-1145(+)
MQHERVPALCVNAHELHAPARLLDRVGRQARNVSTLTALAAEEVVERDRPALDASPLQSLTRGAGRLVARPAGDVLRVYEARLIGGCHAVHAERHTAHVRHLLEHERVGRLQLKRVQLRAHDARALRSPRAAAHDAHAAALEFARGACIPQQRVPVMVRQRRRRVPLHKLEQIIPLVCADVEHEHVRPRDQRRDRVVPLVRRAVRMAADIDRLRMAREATVDRILRAAHHPAQVFVGRLKSCRVVARQESPWRTHR